MTVLIYFVLLNVVSGRQISKGGFQAKDCPMIQRCDLHLLSIYNYFNSYTDSFIMDCIAVNTLHRWCTRYGFHIVLT